MEKFPPYFPDNFVEEILPKEAKPEAHLGYRIAKYGLECPVSYMPTYIDNIIEAKGNDETCDAEVYSTSLFDLRDRLEYFLTITMRDGTKPKACLIMGNTAPECGPSKIGHGKKYRGRHGIVHDHHISWWIYEDTCPWEHFRKVDDE